MKAHAIISQCYDCLQKGFLKLYYKCLFILGTDKVLVQPQKKVSYFLIWLQGIKLRIEDWVRRISNHKAITGTTYATLYVTVTMVEI